MAGCHVTSSPRCWWTKRKVLSLAPFVRPPATLYIATLLFLSLEIVCKSLTDNCLFIRSFAEHSFSESQNSLQVTH